MEGFFQDGMSMVVSFNEETNIVIITPPENFKDRETLAHAKANLNYALTEYGAKAKAVLATLPSHYITVEASLYYKEHAPDLPIALVGNSSFQMFIGKLLLRLTRAGRPIKMFSNAYEAEQWLNEITALNAKGSDTILNKSK